MNIDNTFLTHNKISIRHTTNHTDASLLMDAQDGWLFAAAGTFAQARITTWPQTTYQTASKRKFLICQQSDNDDNPTTKEVQ